MTTKTIDTDYGVGYGHDDYAGTTASRAELERLARLVSAKMAGGYRYARASSDDESALRPCGYPVSLDGVLAAGLRGCSSWEQANATVAMTACQISQTGYAGSRRATADEKEWAHMTFAGWRALEVIQRVPGTCRGCTSTPCRCLA